MVVRLFAGGGEAALLKQETTMEQLPASRVMPPRELVVCWREVDPLPRHSIGSVTWTAAPPARFRSSHSLAVVFYPLILMPRHDTEERHADIFVRWRQIVVLRRPILVR